MPDFAANLTPIQVPNLASSSADDIARFQAQLSTNIVTTGNTLLQNYLDLKGTDFYQVGDLPSVTTAVAGVDSEFYERAKSPQPELELSFVDIQAKIDQLASLISPDAPELSTLDQETPNLDATAPTITMPLPPSTDVGAAPSNAPNLIEPAIPDAPVIALPSVPSFEDLQLPPPPALSIPTWSAVAPVNLLSPPTAQFDYVDQGYASDLHDPLVQKLLSDLTNGSYGIDSNDESLLWGRARDRGAQASRAGVEEAVRRMSSASFPVPQGTMYEAVLRAEDAGQKIVSDADRDIRLRRSELYVQGRKFTIEQVQGYERIRIDLYNATQERALNYAKAAVELSIALYDSSVKNYSAQLEGYKVEATVFESRIRAELAKATIFKTQIEAESLRVEFNKAKIDQYLAQLKGIESVVELYKARIGAAEALTRLQGQKLDVFKSQIEAYATRVRAKEAEYGMYSSQIRGQMASVDVYKAQIEAYNATLSGVETRGRIQLQNNETLLQSYKAAAQQYANELDGFSRQLSAELESAKMRTTAYASQIDAYRAYVNAALEGGRLSAFANTTILDAQKFMNTTAVDRVKFRLAQLDKSVELQKDVNSHGIDFLRAALGSAVSGLNSLGLKSE